MDSHLPHGRTRERESRPFTTLQTDLALLRTNSRTRCDSGRDSCSPRTRERVRPELVDIEFDPQESLDATIEATTRAELDLALKADGIGVNLAASMRLVGAIVALHAKRPGLPPDIDHMLRLMVVASQTTRTLDFAMRFGDPEESTVTRAALASVQVLAGHALKPQGRFQVGERFFAQSIIDYLDSQRAVYMASGLGIRRQIIESTRAFVFSVVGKRPPKKNVRLALATPRRKRGGLTMEEKRERKLNPSAGKLGQDDHVRNMLADVGLVYANGKSLRRGQHADRKK